VNPEGGQLGKVAFASLAPIPMGWLFVFVGVRVWSWVFAGTKQRAIATSVENPAQEGKSKEPSQIDWAKCLIRLVAGAGFEPATFGL
jgi:hypothetical protein